MEQLAENLRFELKDKILTLSIDTAVAGIDSVSGKSRVVASTRGNIAIPGMPILKLGLNLYRPILHNGKKVKGE